MLPMILKMRIAGESGKSFRLFFPVVLVWILLFALFLALLPLVLLAAILTCPWGPGFRLLAVYPLLVAVLFNLSGLHIDVQDARQQIYLHFS